MLDRNGDGQITKEELSEYLENLGIYIPNKALGAMIEKTDTNCGGVEVYGVKAREASGGLQKDDKAGEIQVFRQIRVSVVVDGFFCDCWHCDLSASTVPRETMEQTKSFWKKLKDLKCLQEIAFRSINGWFWGKE
ncbi:hypothetical protein MRB53_026767 [Persea americana]|uniref:Uncharacterized protein n=1 Tax=Persea americana TaxID=3435 RepID=A0ACC2LIZ7_PERAE|nr:hypothetical protein MRB53_026767 [Persea americana]